MFWGVVTLKGPQEVWSHSSVKRAEPIPDWNDYDIPLVSMTAGCEFFAADEDPDYATKTGL